MLWKYSSIKIYKSQVQGTSLCIWGVVCKELCSNYKKLLGHLKLGQSQRGKREELNY